MGLVDFCFFNTDYRGNLRSWLESNCHGCIVQNCNLEVAFLGESKILAFVLGLTLMY